jgi:hypothetical protein
MYISSVFTVPNSKIFSKTYMRLKRWQTSQVEKNSKHAKRQTTNTQEDIECDAKCTLNIRVKNTKRIKWFSFWVN